MSLIRKLCFYAAWACLVLGSRLADLAREPADVADDYGNVL